MSYHESPLKYHLKKKEEKEEEQKAPTAWDQAIPKIVVPPVIKKEIKKPLTSSKPLS